MKLLAALILLMLFGLASAGRAAAQHAVGSGTFRIVADRSTVNFAVKSPVGRFRAQVPVSVGELKVDADGRISGGTTTLDTAGMIAPGSMLGHLKGPKGFDVVHHPTAQFVVSDGTISAESMTLSGALTVRGTTHPVTLSGKITRSGANRIVADLRGTIDRTAYGITVGRPVYSRTADIRLRLVVARGR